MKSSDEPAGDLIQVTQLGLVSSLGSDAPTCCAAARAGLTRLHPLEAYPVTDTEGEATPLLVHAAPVGVQGFEGDARLLQLLAMALRDGIGAATADPASEKTRAYLALPDAGRWRPDGEGPGSLGDDGLSATKARAAWLWTETNRILGDARLPPLRHVECGGHTAFHRVLAQAIRDLRSNAVDVAVVAAVDSLLDPEGLALLEEAGRLKTPNDPAGLQPGEAAGCVVVRRQGSDTHRATPLASLRALAFAREPQTDPSRGAPTGLGIAQALHDAARHLTFTRLLPLWAACDHNGEPWRAVDWGSALVHIRDRGTLDLRGDTLLPAAAVGDTGVASGIVALCMAVQAFSRGYAPAAAAALVSCADGEERSALLCEAA